MLADKASGKTVNSPISNDKFKARQRIRQAFDAIVSDSLSGTVFLEIGHQRWGQASTGAALGADGTNVIHLRQAYIDWMMPGTEIRVRMGLQNLTLPNAAGGSTVLADTDAAAITASWKLSENLGLSAMWLRAYNDNYNGHDANYLDNIDLFMLSIPIKHGCLSLSPWAMYGIQGKNALKRYDSATDTYSWTFIGNDAGNIVGSLGSMPFGNGNLPHHATKPYGSMLWLGLPATFRLDPVNVEFEFDYGHVEDMGHYTVEKSYYGIPYSTQRASTERHGWVAKALVEYGMEWGKAGIYGWYGSGDDGSLKNGSERLPFIYAQTKFTSVLGDDVGVYGAIGSNDRSMSFDGKWGVGLRLKDISFLPDVKHLLRATWISGTNDPGMVRYAAFLCRDVYNPALAWQGVPGTLDYYLTTRDNLLEFDFQTVITIYENLKMGVEFDYVINMLDKNLWKQAANTNFSKTDMWVADIKFAYTF